MLDATAGGFGCADLTTFCRLDELGLVVTGQRLDPDRAVLACRVAGPDRGGPPWGGGGGPGGAIAVGAGACRAAVWCGGLPTNRSGGVRPRSWSRSAATGAPSAGT